jgi:hypothetical protein
MTELIINDFKANKFYLLFVAVMTAYYSFISEITRGGFTAFLTIEFVFIFITPFMFLSQSEKNKEHLLYRSLPVSARSIVAAKYISSWIIIMSLILILLFVKPQPASTTGSFTLYSVLAIIALNIVIFFPVLFRFGSSNTIIISIIFLNIALAIIYSLQRAKIHTNVVFKYLLDMVDYVSKTGGQIKNYTGENILFSAFLLIIILLNFASYKVSVYMFKKREL